ncbi:MAG: amino acid adenylation domain-containing protein [Oscillospiraceae bacterium]|nr:amino acid adenylation domain-containing protein [Oscillospiraceae bacterium]
MEYRTLTEWFESQAQKTPNKIAVGIEGKNLTYSQLNDRSNYVGWALHNAQIGKDDIVAIVMERSIETIIGILGVLKAGAAFLPIDISAPIDRIRFTLQDSNAKAVLTNTYKYDFMKKNVSTEVYSVDIDDIKKEPTGVVRQPTDTAYAIYTSGTTGEPKGALLEDAGLVNYMREITSDGSYSEDSVMLQKAIISFDASIFEIFLALLSGSKLQLLSESENEDFSEVLRVIRENNVTHALMVPTVLSALLDYMEENNLRTSFDGIRRVYTAGEELTLPLLEKYSRITGTDCSYISNLYGPTECSIGVIGYDINEQTLSHAKYIPIGKPINGVSIYIINEGKLCDVNEEGELHIGGVAVGKGYINRPELTAEKFIQNPFNTDERIYRSGDLAKWDEDGNIVFLGRIDEQVKINGLRIELAEIKNRLATYPGVIDAAVVMQNKPEHKYLVGYLVAKEEDHRDRINEHLSKFLPEYMIPQHYIYLEKLPFTASGKLDKKALPDIQVTKQQEFVEPTTPEQKTLVKVMEKVLGIKNISINSDFFMLGGDSIKAIRIVSKLREEGYRIQVSTIMKTRRIQDIAEKLIVAKSESNSNDTVVGEVALTPIQHYFFTEEFAARNHFNQTFLLQGEQLNPDYLRKSIEALLTHHDMLRAIYPDGKQIIQAENAENLYEFITYDFPQVKSEEDALENIYETEGDIQRSIILETGPLVKVVLYRTPFTDYVLFIIHHLVVDGISWRIVVEDFNRVYRQLNNQEAVHLPDKTASFQAWSNALQQYGKSNQLEKEKPYWQNVENTIRDEVKPLRIARTEEGRGRTQFVFSQKFTEELIIKSGKPYNTEINDLLVAALARTLASITESETVAFNMEGHGREPIHMPIDIDRTVSWFTSVFPVMLQQVGKSVRQDIRNAKEMLRRIPNKGLGHSVLNAGKLLDSSNRLDVLFNYLGDFGIETDDYDMKIHTIEFGSQVSDSYNFISPISIDGSIINNQLHVIFSYHNSSCDDQLITRIKDEFITHITEVVNHCIESATVERTASDFGELTWQDDEFCKVFSDFSRNQMEISKILPLTPLQEGMLYDFLSGKRKTSYHVQSVYTIDPDVSPEMLSAAFSLLCSKHSALRTRIVYKGTSDPRQVIVKEALAEFINIDATIDCPELALAQTLQADLDRGFDLDQEGLFRMIFMRCGSGQARLVFSFHHITMDGWCIPILLEDLAYFYDQLCQGKKSLQDEISEDYTYETFIHNLLHSDNSAGLSYWQDLLLDYDKKAEIQDEGIPESEYGESHAISIELSADMTNKVDAFCKCNGITANTLFETAWGLLLQRLTGVDDIAFGKVVSGRNVDISRIEEQVGFFINTIPVRLTTQDNDKLIDVLERMQTQALNSSEHDYIPLPLIQNQSALGSDLLHSLVAFESFEKDVPAALDRLGMRFVKNREQTSYPITFSTTKPNTYRIEIIYDAHIYGQAECFRMLQKINCLLQDMSDGAQKLVSELDCIGEEERDIVLNAFNQTTTNYPKHETVASLFQTQLLKYPKRDAVYYQNESITYEELNDKAERLAQQLEQMHVGKCDVVAVTAAKGIEVIIGFLGVLKCGAVYLPLDINNPPERFKYIMNDSQCKAIVDLQNKLDIPQDCDIPVIRALNTLPLTMRDRTYLTSNSDDLAYIIYTSGTTGEPKGVLIRHKSIVRLVRDTNYYDFDGTRILQTGSLTFDACTYEIWGALLNGGAVYLADMDVLTDLNLLKHTIESNRIDGMFLTTALFRQIVEIDPTALGGLKNIIYGGEKSSREPAERFLQANPHVILTHAYGPTECTTFATTDAVEQPVPQILSIGKPISNTTAYILRGSTLCGIGMPGELCLGGDGLAVGYLNSESLTNEKFIENPFNPSEKIYRTGDIVRWLSNGNIDYLSRNDRQVKIRGFRIELEEIRSILESLEDVDIAAVLVHELGDEKQLCAYLQLRQGSLLDTVRETASQYLPSYMIPQHFVEIDVFPVNKNGKLDLSALPKPTAKASQKRRQPKDALEHSLLEIYQHVLGIQDIGVDDSFYDLGGHSLKAIRLAHMIEQKIGIRLLVDDLMERKTVSNLASMLRNMEESESVKIPKASDNEMNSVQKRIFALEQLGEDSAAYNIPVVLKLDGRIDIDRLDETIRALCERHEILRTSFREEDGRLIQVVSDNVDLKLITKECKTDVEIEELINETVRPFDLETAPPLRAYLFHLPTGQDVLLFDIHHIAFDGSSIPIFLDELSKLYNGEMLPALPLQYMDYSAWNNKYDYSKAETYWLNELKGEEFNTHLMEDYVRSNMQTFAGDTYTLTLDDHISKAIKTFALQNDVTEYMVYLTVVSVLLARYCRQDNVFVGTAASGRTHPDIQDMVGMFVNTLVFKGEVNEEMRFSELLAQTKKKCLEMYKHQDYPFEMLVEKLGISRSSARNPIFDVLFSIEEGIDQPYPMGDVKGWVQSVKNTSAKFDLVINVKQSSGQSRVCWEYNRSLFSESSMTYMATHFETILRQAIHQPDQKIAKIKHVDAHEEKTLLQEFVKGTESNWHDQSLLQLFEKHVDNTPDKCAIRLGEDSLTYQQLNNRANGVAEKLLHYGMGRNDIAALLIKRSIETIVAIVAVLKVGASYLPIDPTNPKERIEHILEDSKAKVILTNCGSNLDCAGSLPCIEIQHIGALNQNVSAQVPMEADDIAYVIYTSGTTGQPKGVPIRQKSLVNLMEWQIKQADIREDSVVLQKSTYTFDASVWEIYLSLLSGATLQMLSQEENQDLHKLTQVIKTQKVTHTLMVPTMFDALLDYMIDENEGDALNSLERLYLGAEELTMDLLGKYKSITGKTIDNITNLYGPTEGTVCVTSYDLNQHAGKRRVPIGKPIQGANIYILNNMQLCGVGMVGELCIGGTGITMGYIGLPELTEEKFVPNPYKPDETLYRTGDLARWNADGTIEYLGRQDDQVKIRGFRVELSEIREKCIQITGVNAAAVVIKHVGNEPAICCYVVKDEAISVSSIQDELRNTLPDYMIPAHICAMDELPFTVNGKLNAALLPTPEPAASKNYVEPAGDIECTLEDLFKTVLDLPQVSALDNFFEIGGHSIKAASLVRQIEKALHVRISMKDILLKQNIRNIANLITEMKAHVNKQPTQRPLMRAKAIN